MRFHFLLICIFSTCALYISAPTYGTEIIVDPVQHYAAWVNEDSHDEFTEFLFSLEKPATLWKIVADIDGDGQSEILLTVNGLSGDVRQNIWNVYAPAEGGYEFMGNLLFPHEMFYIGEIKEHGWGVVKYYRGKPDSSGLILTRIENGRYVDTSIGPLFPDNPKDKEFHDWLFGTERRTVVESIPLSSITKSHPTTAPATQQLYNPHTTLSLQEHLSAMKDSIRRGLSLIGKPVPDNPYDPAVTDRCGYFYENSIAEMMDHKVRAFIKAQLEKGMALEELIMATEDELTWSEWPKSFSGHDKQTIRGINDAELTDEEWLDRKNDLVILYQIHTTQTGNRVHLFQNSFRSRKKDELSRGMGPFYCCVTVKNGETHLGELYNEFSWDPRGTAYSFMNRWMLGFLVLDSESIPGCMIHDFNGDGDDADSVGELRVTLYLWNSEYNFWEGHSFWSTEGQPTKYEYNGETMDLTYYKCLTENPKKEATIKAGKEYIEDKELNFRPNPDTLDIPACPVTVNLKDYYFEIKEGLETSSRNHKGERIYDILMPPKEMYKKAEEHFTVQQ